VKRLFVFAVAGIIGVVAGCGGGSSITPPPPTGGFSNSSLKGQYAYSMVGEDVNGGFLARVGSFTADGNGTITAATEDLSGTGRVAFTGGTYSIQMNGKGALTLTQNATAGLGLSIALSSTSAGLMVQTDLNATSSGSFNLQSPGSFSVSGINNNYVFSTAGVEGTVGAPLAVMGQIATNGGGTVSSGVIDINDGALTSVTPPAAIPTGGTYGGDLTNPNDLASFGRGAITFDGFTFVFYIVDSTHLFLLEEDGANETSGDAFQQNGTIPTQTSNFSAGSFAYLIGGAAVTGNFGPIARAARFTTDGSGNLSKVFLDDNNDGSLRSIGSNSTVTQATYAVDTSSIAVNRGRGTFTFTQSGLGTFSYVFYLMSPTQAVLQDQSNGLISSGSMLGQSGTISNSSLAGNYAFNWSGQVLPSGGNVGFEEDFAGQYVQTSSSSNNISGAVDFVELGSLSNHVQFLNSGVAGTFNPSGDGTDSNNYQVTVSPSGAPATTFNYKAYLASGNTIFLVSADSTRVTAGTVSPQH